MSIENQLHGRSTMEGTAAVGHGPGVNAEPDEATSRALSVMGAPVYRAFEELEKSLRVKDAPTLTDTAQGMAVWLERIIIEHKESIDDWVQALFPRGEFTADGLQMKWRALEINAHAALPSPEGHGFHIMTHQSEEQSMVLSRYGIGQTAFHDDLQEVEGRTILEKKIANIPSSVIRTQRLLALKHMIELPKTLKSIMDLQGVKAYQSVSQAFEDSIRWVGIMHAEMGLYRLWLEISEHKQFDHILMPKGTMNQVFFSNTFETESFRTGRPTHRALRNPESALKTGLSNAPTFWTIDPVSMRDISSNHSFPLRRTFRFGEQAMIDGTHLVRQPVDSKGLDTLNELSVQVIDAKTDDWSTLQYLDALRHTGRWDFKRDAQGPLDPKHEDFSSRGFAYVENENYRNSYNSKRLNYGWVDTYSWVTEANGALKINGSAEKQDKSHGEAPLLLAAKRWGDQSLFHRSLEFDDQHVKQSLELLGNILTQTDHDNLAAWQEASERLSNPTVDIKEYLTKMASASQTRNASVPYGFGNGAGMYFLAEQSRYSKRFIFKVLPAAPVAGTEDPDVPVLPSFLEYSDLAKKAWISFKKVSDFIRKIYPGCLDFIRDNSLPWIAETSRDDWYQIQMWELFASDKSSLPIYKIKGDATEDGQLAQNLKYKFDTEEKMKKLKFVLKTLYGTPKGDDIFKDIKNPDGRDTEGIDLSILDGISNHEIFSHDIQGKYFSENGTWMPDALNKFAMMNKEDPSFDIAKAKGMAPAKKDIETFLETLDAVLMSILILTDTGSFKYPYSVHYDTFIDRRKRAAANLLSKRSRDGVPNEQNIGGFTRREERIEYVTLSVEWWKANNFKYKDSFVPASPQRPNYPDQDGGGPHFVPGSFASARGHRDSSYSEDKRSHFSLSKPNQEFDTEQSRVLAEALRSRQRDSLFIGYSEDEVAIGSENPLPEHSEVYHYQHVAYNLNNGVFWRRDPRPDSNGAFYEVHPMVRRLKNVRDNFGYSPISLALSRAFLFSSITYQSLAAIAKSGGLPPCLSLIFLRPFAEIYTQALIFANKSGVLFSKHPNMMAAPDVDTKMWKYHYTEWMGIAQRDMTTVMIRPDTILDGYRRGLNVSFFPTTWKADMSMDEEGMADYSYFVADCGCNFSRESLAKRANPVALTGNYNPDTFQHVNITGEENEAITNPKTAHFPGSNWLNYLHALHGLIHSIPDESDSYEKLRNRDFHDGLCWRGTQRVWNGKKYKVMVQGNGVLRDWPPPILPKLAGTMPLTFWK